MTFVAIGAVRVNAILIFQVRADVGVDTKHQTMAGLSFPLTDDAIHKLHDLKEGAITYVQLVSITRTLDIGSAVAQW